MLESNAVFLIVTPSYNQVEFIPKTIQSVLSQKNISVQYWVIDGKSSDGTVVILKKFRKKIQWLSEKDKGQTDALNKGIKKLTIENKKKRTNIFFSYINSDDYYLPGALGKISAAFQKQPHAMWLVGDCRIVNKNGQKIQGAIQWYKKMWRQVYNPWMLFITNPLPQPAVFLRWEVVKEIGSFSTSLRYVMDYEYWLRVQERFGKPIFLEDELAAFRIHEKSKGTTQFYDQFTEELEVLKRFTKQPVLLFLHWLHNWLITTTYSLIK